MWCSLTRHRRGLHSRMGQESSQEQKLSSWLEVSFSCPEYSLFVGDLTSDVDDGMLYEFFVRAHPPAGEARWVLDQTGGSGQGLTLLDAYSCWLQHASHSWGWITRWWRPVPGAPNPWCKSQPQYCPGIMQQWQATLNSLRLCFLICGMVSASIERREDEMMY